jgi:hypothetical protein
MRRKQLQYNFCQNIEWLESPENHGLVLPYHRPFCPSLFKSAPCNCCAVTTQNTCLDCRNAMPTNLTLNDPFYGSTPLTKDVPTLSWIGINPGVNISNGRQTACGVGGSIGSVTTSLKFQLSCSTGNNNFFLFINQYQCGSGVPADNSITGLSYALTALTVSTYNIATHPQDCTSPSFSFNVSSGTLYFYTTGTTLTVS